MIDREGVDRWLADYVTAWRSYDPKAIADLFNEDIAYRYHPGDDPIVGRDDVVASWLDEGDFPDAPDRDEEGTYDAEYRVVAVDGDVAVAVGVSTYCEEPGGPVATTFDNCFVMRFDEEVKCIEFTEWFVERKSRD